MVDTESGVPWTRKHDDPDDPLVDAAPAVVYPKDLDELREICRDPSRGRLKAAGSHWALSAAAVSDHTFIETHDPEGRHRAMGRTLSSVIPAALNRSYVDWMVDSAEQGEGMWSLVHIEAGKRIYQLYAELDQVDDLADDTTLGGFIKRYRGNTMFTGPWGFATLGGAGGQTVVGAFSTGTHGGDFDRPPLADSVLAIHLVVDGGKHYWIEPDKSGLPALTDADALHRVYDGAEPDAFEVTRETDLFDAVLVSAGRFGAIYSVVLRAVPQYALHEKRRLHLWQDVKHEITNRSSPLYADATPPGVTGEQRFLQVAVSLTTHANFQRNLVGITKRWTTELPPAAPGRAERVGDLVPLPGGIDPQTQSPRFTMAGANHPFSPDPNNPDRAEAASMLELACADGSFVRGAVKQAIREIEKLVQTDGAVVGAGIAAVAAVGGGGLLLLLLAFAIILAVLAAVLSELESRDTRFGEALEMLKERLLDPTFPDPATKAAGLFTWQLIYYFVFSSQQDPHDYAAVSYAVMDLHDYRDRSCNVHVDSVEIFFEATDQRLIAFIDALIAFEMQQELNGKALAGYASLRFTEPTRALLGMQRFPTSCSVEIACLKDVTGGSELIDYAIAWASNPNIGGVLHWGQRNDWTRVEVERIYRNSTAPPGDTLTRWRAALDTLTEGRNGFSSAFTQQLGLEP